MFALPPFNDSVRDALDGQVHHFSSVVRLATIAVAIGVALEGVELLHDARAWIKGRQLRKKELAALEELAEIFPAGEAKFGTESPSDHPGWVKVLARIGLILVVVGVVAEWRYGAELEDAQNGVHEYDLAKLTEANQKAGDAAVSAQTARDAAQRASEYAAWRTITDEQGKVIRTCVGSSLNGHTLTIQANPDEAEIWAFASRIVVNFGMMQAKEVLWPRGWIVPAGLKFSVGKNRQRDFELMTKALDAAGVDEAARLKDQSDHKNVSDDDLILTVGPRH
jgi:hypothetical protein